MFSYRSPVSGFTLIELLVVVAIIGMLSSVIMVSLNDARAKSRHAKRLQDMQTLMQALEMYASDNAGRYPTHNDAQNKLVSIKNDLVPAYLPKLPSDPYFKAGTTDDYRYRTDTSGTGYVLLMRLEKAYSGPSCTNNAGSCYWCRMSSSPISSSWDVYPFCADVSR